jgi:DNA-directed RNA polymerase specialized sigma24 family protein
VRARLWRRRARLLVRAPRFDVESLLAALPARQRNVLFRLYLVGESPEDVARALRTSEQNVRKLASRAKSALRKIFSDRVSQNGPLERHIE